MLRVTLVSALLLPIVAPVVSGDTGECSPYAEVAASLPDGYYVKTSTQVVGTKVYSTEEIWRETNGADGLQTYRYRCSDGTAYQPDSFVGRVCTQSSGASLFCVVNLGL